MSCRCDHFDLNGRARNQRIIVDRLLTNLSRPRANKRIHPIRCHLKFRCPANLCKHIFLNDREKRKPVTGAVYLVKRDKPPNSISLNHFNSPFTAFGASLFHVSFALAICSGDGSAKWRGMGFDPTTTPFWEAVFPIKLPAPDTGRKMNRLG